MKKRTNVANIQVKQDMYKALLVLLEEKPISAVSVSDLSMKAQVSRMSFYRNYNSIEDILIEHMEEIVAEYEFEDMGEWAAETERVYYGKAYMLHCFRFFYRHHEFIDTLLSCGMGDLFLVKITDYLIRKWVDTERGTRADVLRISAYAGAVYNMYREWKKNDFQEKPEDIALILHDMYAEPSDHCVRDGEHYE